MAFTPKQQNWHIYKNDAAEPTVALGIENAVGMMVDNTSIIRIRATIAETAGKAGSGAVTVEYSTDDSSFTAFGAGNAWNYADGMGAEANLVTTNLCTDTSGKMHYHETGTLSESWALSTGYELDFAVAPTATVGLGAKYYFRFKIAGSIVALNTSKTHPQVRTVRTAAGGIRPGPGTSVKLTKMESITKTSGMAMSGLASSAKIFFQTLLGAIKPTGVLVGKALKSLVGGIASSGAATKISSFFRSLAGGIASSGAATKISSFFRSLAGGVTSSAIVFKRGIFTLPGTITSAGVLVGKALKSLVGGIASSGATIEAPMRAFLQTCTAGLTASGIAAKTWFLTFIGGLFKPRPPI